MVRTVTFVFAALTATFDPAATVFQGVPDPRDRYD